MCAELLLVTLAELLPGGPPEAKEGGPGGEQGRGRERLGMVGVGR